MFFRRVGMQVVLAALACSGCADILGADYGDLRRETDSGGREAGANSVAEAGAKDAAEAGANDAREGGSQDGSDASPPIDGPASDAPGVVSFSQLLVPEESNIQDFGYRTVLHGDTLMLTGFDPTRAGSVHVYERQPGGRWSFHQKLTAGTYAADYAQFGTGLAFDGDWAVIGASAVWHPEHQAGEAFFFKRTGGTWTFTQRVQAPAPVIGDVFGWVVALHGNVAFVAAPHDSLTGPYKGNVYVYERDGADHWNYRQPLLVPDSRNGLEFGGDLAFDGSTLVSCAAGDDTRGSRSGAAYLFAPDAGAWTFREKLTSSAGQAPGYRFCDETGIALQGDTLFVGAPGAPPGGIAYALEHAAGGGWSSQVIPPPASAIGARFFGLRVAVDGDTALVGMWASGDVGSVYVYRRRSGVWEYDQRFDDGTNAGDSFAWSMAFEGTTAAVNSLGSPMPTGAVRIFTVPRVP